MRMLVSFAGGTGHFLPLVPLARAARAEGDAVLVTGQAALLPTVTAAGFTAVDSGGTTLADPAARRDLARVDRAAEAAVILDVFAGSLARSRAARLMAIARHWRPDVIVHDEMDFGAALTAESLGRPRVEMTVLLAGGTVDRRHLTTRIERTRRSMGLTARPGSRRLTLVPAPPGFRDPADPLPPPVLWIRPDVLEPVPNEQDPATRRTLAWLARQPARPRILFTLGTIFHQESGDLFSRAVAGLSRLDASIVVTVGREIDPTELGPMPPHVHVERFVPQASVLPHCDLVVCHAGSGSVMGALAFGRPMLLLPMGADQPANADRCADLGVATVLDPLLATVDDVTTAARELLLDPTFRRRAASWRSAAAGLPTAAQALDRVRRLVDFTPSS